MPFPYLTSLGFAAIEDSKSFIDMPIDASMKHESNGYIIKKRKFSRDAGRLIEFKYNFLTNAEKITFDAFFATVGTYKPFLYLHPTTAVTSFAIFESDYSSAYVGVGTNFLWDINAIKIRIISNLGVEVTLNQYSSLSAIDALRQFIDNWTSNTKPFIRSADYLIRNQMHLELGRSGYYPNDAATSEGQSLMIRAFVRAYQTTGDINFINEAVSMANALISSFYFGVEPPSDTSDWDHHWIVNAGDAFTYKGPISGSGPLYDGVVNSSVTFASGYANLGTSLANVYQAFTSNSVLYYNNVFAPLLSGSSYTIAKYVDKDKYVFTNSSGNWSSAYDVSATPGDVLLTDLTVNGSILLNYSVYQTSSIIHAQPFEAWPMWRPLIPGEFTVAGDAIHWLIDAFDLLSKVQPSVARWANAKAAMLRMWQKACFVDQSTIIFKKSLTAPYNSFPLSYTYLVKDNTNGISPPSYEYTYARDNSGFVALGVNADTHRQYVSFENSSLYLNYTNGATFSFELSSSVATSARLSFKGRSTNQYELWINLTGSNVIDALSLPVINFVDFTNIAVWQLSDAGYQYGSPNLSFVNSTLPDGSLVGVRRIVLNTTYDGVGFSTGQPRYGFTTSNPPVVCYKTASSDVQLIVVDHNNWRWVTTLPTHSTMAIFSPSWSAFAIAGYQNNSGTPPIGPNTTQSINDIEFVYKSGGTSSATLDLRYTATSAPLLPSIAGDVKLVSVQFQGATSAIHRVGDATLSTATRQSVSYYPGPLGFQYTKSASTGVQATRSANTGAPFYGPVYIGYQNPIPWGVIGGNDSQITNMLQLICDAQTAYSVQAPAGNFGPVAPIYIWSTWDSEQYGTIGTFTWNGPDPNTSWGGFQYRLYNNIADFLARVKSGALTYSASTLATTYVNGFLSWLDNWLSSNPTATNIPGDFRPTVAPSIDYVEVHMLALAIKGTIFAQRGGLDYNVTTRVLNRLLIMLMAYQVQSGDMAGSFSPDPTNHKDYGFWEAEILDALSVISG